MPRPQVHPTGKMLDAARDLVLEGGLRSATIEAIARSSGAPTGSIYHRFGSRDELVAQLWIRAVYRSQASFLAALEQEDAKDAAIAAAMSIIDFCEEHPDDAQLLAAFRREDLIHALPEGPLSKELEELNRPVERSVVRLATRLFGNRTRASLDRTLLAVFDLPYGAARRYLINGQRLPPGLRGDLSRAISAVIANRWARRATRADHTPREVPLLAVGSNGEGQNRTGDTMIFSHVLYRLSYLAAGPDSSGGRLACGPEGASSRPLQERQRVDGMAAVVPGAVPHLEVQVGSLAAARVPTIRCAGRSRRGRRPPPACCPAGGA